MSGRDELFAHLDGGVTNVCRVWRVARRDGAVFGFTDHDLDLEFDGTIFRASTGMSAGALQSATGLSVDNGEASGALSDEAIREDDIAAGRFDGAEVWFWMVNWQNVEARTLLFRGTFGEIVRSGGAFRAELRGLSEALNLTVGRIFQRQCDAALGDVRCQVDLNRPEHHAMAELAGIEDEGRFSVKDLSGFPPGWFERGRITVLDGPAAGLTGVVKREEGLGGTRRVTLWQGLGLQPETGNRVRLEAGCDRRFETCRTKFLNTFNFRGFPHLPSEDWVRAYPVSGSANDGGSLSG